MRLGLVDWTNRDVSLSKRCVSFAICCLGWFSHDGDAIDDELVDFTQKGGWYKIDTVLCKRSGYDILLLEGGWDIDVWAEGLDKAAEALKVSISPLLCQ
jgi:hypothetical protein